MCPMLVLRELAFTNTLVCCTRFEDAKHIAMHLITPYTMHVITPYTMHVITPYTMHVITPYTMHVITLL